MYTKYTKNNVAAIVLAGGSGKRMKSATKKQYIEIQGKPLIYYSLAAFENSSVGQIVLVCAPGEEDYCKTEIVNKYQLKKVKYIVPGGKERYNSVFEGLKALNNEDYVLIHDGARPFVTLDIIERSIQSVEKYSACVVGMPSKDTVKIVDSNGFIESTPKRSSVWNIQTPQSFKYDIVYNAYEKILKSETDLEITDDAMVVEYTFSIPVKIIEGSYSNIKITTQEDLAGIENYKFTL